MLHRFPAPTTVPTAATSVQRPTTSTPAWLAGLWGVLQRLLGWLRAALPGARVASIPIAVLCCGTDPAGQRRLRQALRAGLRQAEAALAGWPALALSIAVLETVGTPGQTDDLGHLVAACRVRRRTDGWQATIRLATTAEGQPLTNDNRLTALWLSRSQKVVGTSVARPVPYKGE